MIKCPICNDKFNEVEDLYGHLEKEHEESLPKDQSAAQYYYYLKTGKEHGNCVVCKMPTKWNDVTNKYARFCEMASCKEKYKEEFKNRMIGKYGRVHLLNDPDQQRKMLANRSISGKYEWSDNREIPYTGTYELDFLQFLDVFMHFDSEDIMAPSPHTYYYIYEGEEKFYIPDVFIPSLNLEIEIKDGGDNPNTHHKIQAVDKVKEKLKDDVMTSQKQFSYIKIVNKNYDTFFDFMMQKKKEFDKSGKIDEPVFILKESYQPEVVTESMGDISAIEIANEKRFGSYRLYHLSENNLDGNTLAPRVPQNYMTRNGFENNVVERVSFASSIDGCLIGMSANLEGKEFFVHEPYNYHSLDVQRPTTEDVPDADLTGERWVLNSVKLRVTGKIKVLKAHDKPLTYMYGDAKGETYSWGWKFVNFHL